MRNETAKNNRARPSATKPKTGIAPPSGGAVRRGNAKGKGCLRGKKGRAEVRPAGHASNGFLKCAFLPKWAGDDKKPKGYRNEEKEFYQSLSELCAFYGISPLATKHLGYPYNALLALWEVRRKLRQNRRESIGVSAGRDEGGKNFLSALEHYNTGTTLYYIPIVPLMEICAKRKRRRVSGLLLSVVAYLYHIVGVPYYRDTDSYIFWQYDMIGEWTRENPSDYDSPREYYEKVSLLDRAQYFGDTLHRKIWNPCHLNEFENRLQGFVPRDDWEQKCYGLAREVFSLFTDYPESSLFAHVQHECWDDYEEAVTMEKYVSFVADTDGWLYDSLAECVNSEFGNYAGTDQPVIERVFDGREQDGADNLDFECRLFPLIDRLCYLLNTINDGK